MYAKQLAQQSCRTRISAHWLIYCQIHFHQIYFASYYDYVSYIVIDVKMYNKRATECVCSDIAGIRR